MVSLQTPLCDFGWKARDFDLPGVDGSRYNLAKARGSNGLLVMFICNHCPYVKAKFDEILSPVTKIYNLIKYGASLVAVIALLFAGISYMFSGNDIRKRDTSKNMAAYVFIGLVVIWAAPFVVNLLIA